MVKSNDTQQIQKQSQQASALFSMAEKKQIADFFSVLIQIDRRVNITKVYGNKSNK